MLIGIVVKKALIKIDVDDILGVEQGPDDTPVIIGVVVAVVLAVIIAVVVVVLVLRLVEYRKAYEL